MYVSLFSKCILCLTFATYSMGFKMNRQMQSYTSVFKRISTYDCTSGLKMGPLLLSRGKMDCARRCSLLEGCQAFDYRKSDFLCGLLTSSDSDDLQPRDIVSRTSMRFIDFEQMAACRSQGESKNTPSTSSLQESTIPSTSKQPARTCQINAALMNEGAGEFWLFSEGWIYKYSNVADLSKRPKTRVPILEEFPDSSQSITSAYYENGMFYLINGETVYSYDKVQTTYVRKNRIYSHFRSDIPRRIEAILTIGNEKQIFTKLNVFYMTENTVQMRVTQFKSESSKNPYYTEDPSVRPDYVTAATAINNDTYLFFQGNTYFLFKNKRMYRKWKEKGRVVC